jgi:hypothetical protein
VLEGRPTLYTDAGPTGLAPGMCAGFAAGTGDAHHLVNETVEDAVYLEIGDRTPGDAGNDPDDDLTPSSPPAGGASRERTARRTEGVAGRRAAPRASQPRRAASIAATSIFRIVIIASNARLAAAGSGSTIASVSARGVICQE